MTCGHQDYKLLSLFHVVLLFFQQNTSTQLGAYLQRCKHLYQHYESPNLINTTQVTINV